MGRSGFFFTVFRSASTGSLAPSFPPRLQRVQGLVDPRPGRVRPASGRTLPGRGSTVATGQAVASGCCVNNREPWL
ncbi:unnamed protein product [Gadus morhua 'NCC']